uniref:Uncharacterized protein n=1 Tax=Solanum lycopersicum TaxID=4081 RepID=A0A3Q7FDA5_SOLLC
MHENHIQGKKTQSGMELGYHASDKYKRKSDYDKGFNNDWTVTDSGDRIVEMTEKSKIRMEDP